MTVIQNYERLNLGGLIDLLKGQPDKDQHLRFDFAHVTPLCLTSFRGYYEDLAIEFSDAPREYVTVAEFLTTLKEAVGKVYTGYKGGDYKMTRNTRIWVANYSHTSNTTIIGVRPCDYMVVLHTGWEE
jgi:hypothetical protein